MNKLDLSICEGKEILIGYPVDISENELDLYNSSSDYYSDICYTYTNSKGTDVTLNDRQMEHIYLLFSLSYPLSLQFSSK